MFMVAGQVMQKVAKMEADNYAHQTERRFKLGYEPEHLGHNPRNYLALQQKYYLDGLSVCSSFSIGFVVWLPATGY